jgi:hypothetical protein
MTVKERDAIIKKIDSLQGKEQKHIEWLLSLLDHTDSLVRLCAIRPLVHECSVPNLAHKLWAMVVTESDEDVLLVVISALAERCRGSKDSGVLDRFQKAIERVGGGLEGTRETFDDAKLKIMLGLDAKQIVKMPVAERRMRLAELNAQLGIKRTRPLCRRTRRSVGSPSVSWKGLRARVTAKRMS